MEKGGVGGGLPRCWPSQKGHGLTNTAAESEASQKGHSLTNTAAESEAKIKQKIMTVSGGSCHKCHFCRDKHLFCRDKSMLAMTKCLSWQTYFCHNKIFLLRQRFCRNKFLSWQTCVCHDKSFVATTKDMFCHDKSKHVFVMTKVLSWQKYFCHDKSFVTTSILLSQQKTCFVATNTGLSWQNFCCNKNDTCGSCCQWYMTVIIPC